MARKPNYRFERFERERKKAAKKAEKAERRKAEKEGAANPDGLTEPDAQPDQPPAEE
jgi:hypothetical protein